MTPPRDLAANRRWADDGTALFLRALAGLTDDSLEGPTELPDWTRMHLVAHVAGNAEALRNLASWAATGEETPMYSSPDQRNSDIRVGARRPPADVRRWAEDSALRLSAALAELSEEQWSHTVRTAQGRLVPAGEIPWLRAREVMIHSIDLDPTLSFDALPDDFLLALIDEVATRRSDGRGPALVLGAGDGRPSWRVSGRGEPSEVHGSLGNVAAYLTGRPWTDLTATVGAVPDLPPWL
ncbi:MAG: mycothiol-dependent maleylpyruvate isomerase [Blastococcus sp.]|jgi:maleylpyruvate isomerase|nr:mycothiol-dependent maleylpyruvate isomerase [Blastococcus sp.]